MLTSPALPHFPIPPRHQKCDTLRTRPSEATIVATSRLLPQCNSHAELKSITNAAFAPAIEHLRAAHSLTAVSYVRFTHGSCFTFDAGTLVYKFYAPLFPEDFDRELLSLEFLAKKLAVPTPELVAAGMLDDWHYIVMTRLSGETLLDLWPEMSPPDRARVSAAAGELLAAIHALEVPTELDVLNAPEGWDAFIEQQLATVVERNSGSGIAETWIAQLPEFMASQAATMRARKRVFLHTEVGSPHLLVHPETLELTGLVDFEPSMVGNPGYDWPSIGLFLTPCDRASFRAFASAYGTPPPAQEILAWHMIHRYGSLRQLFARTGSCITATRLEDVAVQVFA